MGLNKTNNSGMELNGTYKNINRETLDALRKAAKSGNKLESAEIDEIENNPLSGHHFSIGELKLFNDLKSQSKNENVINNLSFIDLEIASTSETIDLKFDKTQVSVISPKAKDTIAKPDLGIKNAEKNLKQAINFSEKYFALNPDEQKEVSESIKILQKGLPQSADEITAFLDTCPEPVKKALATLEIDKLKEPEEIKQFFKSKTFNQIGEFLADGVKLSAKEQGKTIKIMQILNENPPAKNFRSEIKKLMDSMGRDRSMEVGKTINKLGIFIPSTTLDAPTSEDASARIKSMIMGDYNYGPTQQDYVIDNLKIAKKEGFTVIVQTSDVNRATNLLQNITDDLIYREGLTTEDAHDLVTNHLNLVYSKFSGYEWAEDNKFITIGGDLVTLPNLHDKSGLEKETAISRTLAFTTGYSPAPGSNSYTLEGTHTAGLPENDPENMVEETNTQGAVTDRNEDLGAIELGSDLKKKVKITRTYNEGGNMLLGTLPNGESYAVIGRDGLLVSTFHLEEEYKKNKKKVPEFEKIPQKVKEMEKNGALNSQVINETIEKLKAANHLPAGKDPMVSAKEFLARMEIVKDIFPGDIGIPSRNIIFVPQPDFHVDMHLRPLKPGQVLINDHGENIKLLKKAKEKAVKGSWEDKEIDSMIEHSEKIKKVIDPVMNEIARTLEEKGIKVTRSPGVMDGRTKQVNFMNAVPGTSIGTNRHFYITNFTTIKPIRDAFKEFLKTQDIDKVYWAGDSGGTADRPSGSESSLSSMGGMDCRENHEEHH
jgi:hypothetical protein